MSKHEKNVKKLYQKFKKMIYYVLVVVYENFHWKNPTQSCIL